MRTLCGGVVLGLAISALAHDSDVQRQLDEAREHLDAAARHFAELHAQLGDQSVFFAGDGDRAFLGVLIGKTDEEGVHLVGVTPGSGAAEAGIEAGDLVVSVNGVELVGRERPAELLHETMDDVAPGDTVKVELVRDGSVRAFDVTTTSGGPGRIVKMLRSGDFDWTREEFDLENIDVDGVTRGALAAMHGSALGRLQLVDVNADLGAYFGVDSGVLVVAAPDDGELKAGDIIQAIGSKTVATAREAYAVLLGMDDDVEAEVRRQGVVQIVAVTPVSSGHEAVIGIGPHRRVIRIEKHASDGDEDVHVRIIAEDDS